MWKKKLTWKGVSFQLEVATPGNIEEELDAGRDSFLFKASFREGSNVMNHIEVRMKRRYNCNTTDTDDGKQEVKSEYFEEETSSETKVEKVDDYDYTSSGGLINVSQRPEAAIREGDSLDSEDKKLEDDGRSQEQSSSAGNKTGSFSPVSPIPVKRGRSSPRKSRNLSSCGLSDGSGRDLPVVDVRAPREEFSTPRPLPSNVPAR